MTDNAQNEIAMESIKASIQALPESCIEQIYDFVSDLATKIRIKKKPKIRACALPNSLMRTKPISLRDVRLQCFENSTMVNSPFDVEITKWNREELYDRFENSKLGKELAKQKKA